MRTDPLIPNLAVVTDIRVDTPDVKTFRVVGVNGKKPFGHIPGQCAMLSVPGVGEALFSITSSPTEKDFVEFSIKKCGCVTSWLHDMEPGQQITIRGPYGNGFPVDAAFAGKDLLFIAAASDWLPCIRCQLLPALPKPLRKNRHRLRLTLERRPCRLPGNRVRLV